MVTAVRVEAAVPGRRKAGTAEHPVELALAPGPVALRDLIEAVVRAEVRAFAARVEQRGFLRVLTDEALAAALAAGAVRSDAVEAGPPVDEDEAVATALLAGSDGLYQVVVDGEPVADLDAVVDLRTDAQLLFLRLVALSGG